jgi:hypothetical protein
MRKLIYELNSMGFKNTKAIARVVSDVTGMGLAQVYRALLYFEKQHEFENALEITIEKLKQE